MELKNREMCDGELAKYRKDCLSNCNSKNSLNIRFENQEGCVGIRIYYAKTQDDKMSLVLTGVKNNGDDMYDGELAEHGPLCPPLCSSSNPLNS